MLLDSAERNGDRPFVNIPGGELTFAAVPELAARVACGLKGLGVKKGDTVALLLGNRLEFIAAWWGNAWLGGITVPLNPAYRGDFLQFPLEHSEAEIAVVDAQCLDEIAKIAPDLSRLKTLIVVGPHEDRRLAGLELVDWSEFLNGTTPISSARVNFSDAAQILYTSGTTGRPKGVLMSHHHCYCFSVPLVDLLKWGPADHHFITLPLFHVAAQQTSLMAALAAGSRATVTSRFSARNFWHDVAASRANHVLLIGAMGNILMKQDVQPDESNHRLATVWCAPPPSDPVAFSQRFQVRLLWQGYGMTEVYPNQVHLRQADKPITCIGRPSKLFSVRIVDEHEMEVASDGISTGEVTVRANLPYAMMTEYFKDPVATASATRNLWFHTGDLASRDGDGYMHFLGRKHDAIRRRGENVSALEIERVVMSHPAITEAAAFGIPSELGEEDIKVDIVIKEGDDLNPKQFFEYLEARLPSFMLPRFVQVRSELPVTPSGRVQKFKLRADGAESSTFDRATRLDGIISRER